MRGEELVVVATSDTARGCNWSRLYPTFVYCILPLETVWNNKNGPEARRALALLYILHCTFSVASLLVSCSPSYCSPSDSYER